MLTLYIPHALRAVEQNRDGCMDSGLNKEMYECGFTTETTGTKDW